MELEAGYKQTDAGVMPDDWSCSTVRNLASSARNAIVGGPFGSDLVSSDYVNLGVPVIRGQNMSRRWISGSFAYVTEAKAKALEANLARPGDLVFTQRGTLGQVSLVPDRPFKTYVVSQSQMKLSLNRETADPLFYLYVFLSDNQQELIRGRTIQTGVPHINLGILREIPVQRPPLQEQLTIAAVLADTDALLDELDRVIAKKRDIKQGAAQQLLSGETRLPSFGGDWETRQLGELGVWKGGMTPSMANRAFWDPGTVPWLSSGDVKSMFLKSSSSMISSLAVKQGVATMIPATSVVLVMRSGILRRRLPVAVNLTAMAINQDIKALVPNRNVSAHFMLHALTFNGPRLLSRTLKSGTTVESVEFGWLKAFEIQIPSFDEQLAIGAVLSDMDTEIAALEERRAKTAAIKQGMAQALLTGRVRLPLQAEVAA
jgi:type I restriction enzyme, S subunit